MFNRSVAALLLVSGSAFAAADPKAALDRAQAAYEKGDYAGSLEVLEPALGRAPEDPALNYWSGADLFSLQKFELAAPRLELAISKDPKGELSEAPYLAGQTFYSLQKYPEALHAFQLSADRGTELAPSLYYVGYLLAIQKKFDLALPPLERLLKLEKAEPEMREYGAFEIGEVRFAQADANENMDSKREIFLKQAIPAYQVAIGIDRKSEMSAQALQRIQDVYGKLGQSGPVTEGGMPIPVKAWVLTASQDVKYDSNIINQADDKIIKVIYTGSPYEHTGAFGKYEYLYANQIAVTPELGFDSTFNGRQSEPKVYSQNNISLSPALRTRYDRRLWGNPASTLLEYEFNLGLRDFNATHSQDYYSQSHNIVFGERANPFAIGSTTFTMNVKFFTFTSSLSPQDFRAFGTNLSQNFTLPGGYALNARLAYETQSAQDPFNDQRSYTLSMGSGIPDLPWRLSLDYSLSLSVVDTEEQFATRGYEKNISPAVSLTRYLGAGDRYSVNLNYSYSRNASEDTENYAFSKHVLGVGFSAVF